MKRWGGTLGNVPLVILSGILLAHAFPSFDMEWLAWFAFVPLFFALKDKKPWPAFWLSYICGIVFWLIAIYWLAHVTFAGVAVLILYLALYFGLFGFCASCFSSLSPVAYLLSTSAAWALLEYVRSYLLTGFGWALLGYSQYLTLPVIQIADITGAWGVSFVIMAVNIAIFTAIDKKRSVSLAYYALPAAILAATLGYGSYKLRPPLDALDKHAVNISVVQGNIPQELKWDNNAQMMILDTYLGLSEKAAADKPDLIIWPEASSPGFLGEDEWVFDEIFGMARLLKTKLLVGTVAVEDGKYYNSAVLIDAAGEVAGRYDKMHLVPFGEYIPLRSIFGFLNTVVPIGEATKGEDLVLLDAGQARFGVLICFEDVFPELAGAFVKKGADFLVNITNDAWYKKTSSHYQHLSASVFRAVENRVNVIRSANTGISAFISPTGKILARVEAGGQDRFVAGYKTLNIGITENKGLTFYGRYGEVFILAACFLALYGIIRFKRI